MKENSKIQLFYIFPLLYVISIYLFPVCFYVGEEHFIAYCLACLPIVSGVMNIIVSVKFCKPENRIMMFNSMVLVKYALIPFFIIGGMVLAASSLISFAAIHIPILIFAGPIIIAIGSVIGWLVLAFESPYAIACLRLSAKAGVYTTVAAILHIILQFFFTLDVIDIMFLTFKERRWKKLTIFIIILLVIAILLLGTLIVLGINGILTRAK